MPRLEVGYPIPTLYITWCYSTFRSLGSVLSYNHIMLSRYCFELVASLLIYML